MLDSSTCIWKTYGNGCWFKS